MTDLQELPQYLEHVLGLQDSYAERKVKKTGGIPMKDAISFHKAQKNNWMPAHVEEAMAQLNANNSEYHIRNGILFSPHIFQFHATQRHKEQQWLERQATQMNAVLEATKRPVRHKPIHATLNRRYFSQVHQALDEKCIPYKVVDKYPESRRHAILIFAPTLDALSSQTRDLLETKEDRATRVEAAIGGRQFRPE